MTETTMSDMGAALYPPHVMPPTRQMSQIEVMYKLGRNALLTLPEPVYREPIFVASGPL